MTPHVRRVWNIAKQYLDSLAVARKPPIFVVGLPRSGTTWLATTLSKASHTRYYHEPFNFTHFPEVRPYGLRYVTAAGAADDFEAYCRQAFAGKGRYKYTKANGRASRYAWWPARTIVKDVYANLALDWIGEHLKPQIVMVIRHPCAVAASRLRLNWGLVNFELQRLLNQPRLMQDYLEPFRELLVRANQPLEQLVVSWAAVNYVMLKQRETHPHWVMVQHEVLSREPLTEYRHLYATLDLSWTKQVEVWLAASTQHSDTDPYSLRRSSTMEPEKWRHQLTAEQIDQVRRCIEPFELPVYRDFVEGR